MAAYPAAQKSRVSSVGTGEVAIRWVSRIPVRPDPVSVRQVGRRRPLARWARSCFLLLGKSFLPWRRRQAGCGRLGRVASTGVGASEAEAGARRRGGRAAGRKEGG